MVLLDGITYMHEHTTIDLSRLKGDQDTNLNCFDETIQEFKELYEKGVRNIVDVTNYGMQRNPLYVQEVAQQTGLNIIQATGFYQEKFLPAFVSEASVKDLQEIMVKEIVSGLDQSGIKAKLIGEIATSKNVMTPNEKKVFDAAIIAHKETGVPISTHTTLGTFGHEQVLYFKKNKIDLEKVVIGHVDLTGNAEYVLHMIDQGVYVEFDTIGKENYQPDYLRIMMLKEIEKRGFIDRVFLSMDITRKSNLKYMGGIGYSYLLDVFVPQALENGLSQTFIDNMLIHNPKNFFKGVK